MDSVKYGVMHNHTMNSLNDSAMSPKTLVATAAKLGAPAVALTDHGVMTGVYDFMNACKDLGVNGIPGVEAYVQENHGDVRAHLVLLPKSYKGYIAIAKAVTASNERMDGDFPCMNMDILNKHFGPEAEAHGEVIATSACAGGILASIILANDQVDKEISKLRNKQTKVPSPSEKSYLKNVELLEKKGEEIEALVARRDELTSITGKKYGTREKALKNMNPDSDEYRDALNALNADKAATESAALELAVIKTKIASERRNETAIRRQVREAEEKISRWKEYQAQIDELSTSRKPDNELYDAAKKKAAELRELFGDGNFYVELQFHGLDMERTAMPKVAAIAKELGLPLVAANDAHMATNSQEDIDARHMVRCLRFNKWEDPTFDANQYYIKTDEELMKALSAIFDKDTVQQAMEGVKTIAESCMVTFPKELHFPKYTKDGKEVDTKAALRELCMKGKEKRLKFGWNETYQKRLDYELEVIDKMGYNDYLLIVEDFLRVGRQLGLDNEEHVGMGVGQGRGSGAGSLVCFLSGITGVDPLKYNLLFERFLNVERVSYPDIDSDIAVENRDKVIDYCKKVYGENAVCNIVTKGTFAGKAAIRAAARVLGDKYEDKSEYLDMGDRIARLVPATPGATISDIPEEDLKNVEADDACKEILYYARLIEGVQSNYGTHACGVIIADNGNVGEYVPMMKSKDGVWQCQCTNVEAEKYAGLLKFDFLGLKNLSIVTECLRTIKRIHGISLDMEVIGRSLDSKGRVSPKDPRGKGNVFDDIFAKGRTNGVFQFESAGMKKMLKQFKPSNINDIILLVAAYRPGPLQYLDGIIKVKKGIQKPSYIVPALEPILEKTYGFPVYQEEIMEIFNKVAGFSLGQADEVRRAMGKKHIEILLDPKTNFKGKFIDGLIKSGATAEQAEDFWTQLLDFASYAFNKSHACAYAFLAYYTAWLKLYYPMEYMKSLLNYTPLEKLPMFISECKDMGIEVVKPDINHSYEGFEITDGKIIFGLRNVKGVANSAKIIIDERKKNGPYISFMDFVKRTTVDKGTVEALIMAGAFDSFSDYRFAMVDAYNSMSALLDNIERSDAQIQKHEENIMSALKEHDPSIESIPEDLTPYVEAKIIKKMTVTHYHNALDRKASYESALNRETIPVDKPESMMARLESERQLVGMYISGHPLDEYENVEKERTCKISEVEGGTNVTLCGIIEDVRYTKRKKDGADMAFFKLNDDSGDIEVCCFTKAYEENAEFIAPGNAVAITGKVSEPEDDTQEPQLYVQSIKPLERKKQHLILSVDFLDSWTDGIYDKVLQYIGKDCTASLYLTMTGELRPLTFGLRNEIKDAYIDGLTVTIGTNISRN